LQAKGGKKKGEEEGKNRIEKRGGLKTGKRERKAFFDVGKGKKENCIC